MFRSSLAVSALVFAGWTCLGAEPAAKPVPSQEELEKQFAEQLSGAALVGNFTDDADKSGKPLAEERYAISKVSKLKGDLWLFQTRIQYANHDLRLPLPLAVKWAGDTAVITLTDLDVPGLGKFTARVLIYRDQYAGTWRGATHGGHLFGRIEKSKNGAPKPAQ